MYINLKHVHVECSYFRVRCSILELELELVLSLSRAVISEKLNDDEDRRPLVN